MHYENSNIKDPNVWIAKYIISQYLRYGKSVRESPEDMGPAEHHYIWRTKMDERVRQTHAMNEGRIFSKVEPPFPPMGRPGYQKNCRCTEGPVIAEIKNMDMVKFIKMDDTSTWPQPPIDGILVEGPPTKNKYLEKGEKRMYDQYQGEWRIHVEDVSHNIDWDYKSTAKWGRWLNISINNKPPRKVLIKNMTEETYQPNPPIKPYFTWMGDDDSHKIKMKYMPNFKGGFVIIGSQEAYRRAHYFFNYSNNFLLSDEAIAIYHHSPLVTRESLIMSQAERQEVLEVFKCYADGGVGHDYVDMKNAPEGGIMISAMQYNDKIFEHF